MSDITQVGASTELVSLKPISADEMSSHLDLLKDIKENELVYGVHYGLVPGCGKKPVLFKPGAEYFLLRFQFTADPVVEDLSGGKYIRFRVQARIVHRPTGTFVGVGVGECCSAEKQYHTSSDPMELTNNILKKAKARALRDAALTCTGASSLFSTEILDGGRALKQKANGNNGTNGRREPVPMQRADPVASAKWVVTGDMLSDLWICCKKMGWDEKSAAAYLKSKHGIDNSRNISSKAMYDKIYNHFDNNDPEPTLDDQYDKDDDLPF